MAVLFRDRRGSEKTAPGNEAKPPTLAFAVLMVYRMNAKALFKTVFSTALLVLLLLMALHNRTAVDFNLLPVSSQSFHGPIALMYFVFFCGGLLMGMVISIRTDRKQTSPPPDAPTPAPRIALSPEPRIGSRVS